MMDNRWSLLLTKTNSHDLPPTVIARLLPVTKTISDRNTAAGKAAKSHRGKKRGGGGFDEDDTPKAFARLMRFQTLGHFPSGLDDPSTDNRKSKKRKTEGENDPSSAPGPGPTSGEQKHVPKILPGEKMSQFAARVNAALPVSGLVGKKGKLSESLGIKERQTKLERKMQKMQAEWRKEEQRRREKREAELEERDDDIWLDPLPEVEESRGRKPKGKRSRMGKSMDDDDPWEQVKIARNEGPRKLHDVVQAPPKLPNLSKPAFRVANGARVDVAEVPKSAGSLRKREELGLVRRDVLEGYRKRMEGRRGII